MEGRFSVQVCLRDVPAVKVSTDRDCCWLDLDTFSRDNGHTGITIHLPERGQSCANAARALADALIQAAGEIEHALDLEFQARHAEAVQ